MRDPGNPKRRCLLLPGAGSEFVESHLQHIHFISKVFLCLLFVSAVGAVGIVDGVGRKGEELHDKTLIL